MKILFIHQGEPSFIIKDYQSLRTEYEIEKIDFRGVADILKLLKGTLWCDLTFSWFGSIHAFWAVLFSKILRKKSIVVAGGYDVGQADGLWSDRAKRWCPLFVFNNADVILAVSNFNRNEALANVGIDPRKIKLIYHGFDHRRFSRLPGIHKGKEVLTVSQVSIHNLKRKGLEEFVASAALLPDFKFVLVGEWYDDTIFYLKEKAAPNVVFTGKVSEDKLIEYFSRASVYVQASDHEAFGCSLAEAMLCECVPVVARVGAIPEVVGDSGVYLNSRDPEEIATKIEAAYQKKEEMGKAARGRIAELFPLEKRKIRILEEVKDLR